MALKHDLPTRLHVHSMLALPAASIEAPSVLMPKPLPMMRLQITFLAELARVWAIRLLEDTSARSVYVYILQHYTD